MAVELRELCNSGVIRRFVIKNNKQEVIAWRKNGGKKVCISDLSKSFNDSNGDGIGISEESYRNLII